jgi:hypothetical protein
MARRGQVSFFGRVLDWVLGNGKVDHQEHETHIRQKKAEIKGCHEETVNNFQVAQRKFEEIELPEIPEERITPSPEGGSHGRD